MTTEMIDNINLLRDSNDAIDIKVGYMAGDYELEEVVLKCLEILSESNSTHHIKTESIMHFLHS